MDMSNLEKTARSRPAVQHEQPWDSARYMAPDPSLPVEDQLTWYKVASHVLLLNASERCRRAAAAEADRTLERQAAFREFPVGVPTFSPPCRI